MPLVPLEDGRVEAGRGVAPGTPKMTLLVTRLTHGVTSYPLHLGPPQDEPAEGPEVLWTDSPQTAFKDAMGRAHSLMLWHDQMIEDEKQGGAVTEEEPEFGSSPNSDAPPQGLREGLPVMS